MTDIVERLRSCVTLKTDELEAADEIEARDAEVERLRQRVEYLEGYAEGCMEEFNRAQSDLTELRKAQGEPVGVVKHNGLGFPCVDLLGKNGTQYFGLEDGTKLYTSAPSIPEGWQLVPVEPTPEMAEAFMKSLKEPYHPSGEAKYRPLHTWKAMLAAAPNPEDKK